MEPAEWTEREFAKFRMLLAEDAVRSSEKVLAGLEFVLKRGWQFYYEKPREYGVAPKFDWSESHNVKAVSLHWPPPKGFSYSVNPPVITRGYIHSLIIPANLAVSERHAETEIQVHLEYTVCNEFCIVDEVRLSMPQFADVKIARRYAEKNRIMISFAGDEKPPAIPAASR
jgi:DsbC/DsbD-like thiol-disulfide interchange protein